MIYRESAHSNFKCTTIFINTSQDIQNNYFPILFILFQYQFLYLVEECIFTTAPVITDDITTAEEHLAMFIMFP